MYTHKLRVDDLQSERREFDGPTVYARTKRAQVILTELWAEQLAGTGVVVHAMHPGWADTPGVRSSLPRFYKVTRPLLRTPAQGADTIVWLGAPPNRAAARAASGTTADSVPRIGCDGHGRRGRSASGCSPSAYGSAVGTTRPFRPRRLQFKKENLMAHYRASIDIRQPREDVFAYLSDFSTTREWDPGVVKAERLNGQPVGEGTEFRLVAEFLGRKNELTYRIVEYDPPHAVTFLGENATVVSRDRITFESTAEDTRVTYDADLALKGLLRIADPLLALAFNRVGDRALAGLRRTLAPAQPQRLSPLSGRALDGKEYELPGDLAKQHNFIVVAFRREQQRVVDQWLPWLIELEQHRSDVAVYELPVLSSVYGPARWFIDGGMTRGIPDASARARTITVYTDVGKAVDNLGLAGTDTIAVLIVERSGRILASEVGGFDEQKAERLAASLTPTPSPTAP